MSLWWMNFPFLGELFLQVPLVGNDWCISVSWMICEYSLLFNVSFNVCSVVLSSASWEDLIFEKLLTYSSGLPRLYWRSQFPCPLLLMLLFLCILTAPALLLVSTGTVRPVTAWIDWLTHSVMPTTPCQECTDWWGTGLCSHGALSLQNTPELDFLTDILTAVTLCDP